VRKLLALLLVVGLVSLGCGKKDANSTRQAPPPKGGTSKEKDKLDKDKAPAADKEADKDKAPPADKDKAGADKGQADKAPADDKDKKDK
jgi:hypothetical protein